MTTTGYPSFDTTVEKTNRILRDIEHAYGWPKERRNQSYAALRSVLHAVRDRLTVEEAAQLAAQLPMLVRGIYYEGWDPTGSPRKTDRDQFLQRIRHGFPYDIDGGIEELAQTVMRAVRQYVTDGEWEDVRASMPRGLRSLFS
jgi:uncharacterized protein (DUF2267 family)